MDFCASHQQFESCRNKLQELRYPINNINAAINFSQEHPNHRIILEISSLEDCGVPIKKLNKLLSENTQLYLDFFNLSDLMLWQEQAAEKGRYMYHHPVSLWSVITVLCHLQVSDILLGEPLVFQMKEVSLYIKKLYPNIKLRFCPHIGQPVIAQNITNELNHFWVLPQHLYLYEDIIDVCDIFEKNKVRESALVDLYIKQGDYEGPFDILIENSSVNILSSYIPRELAVRRMNCGQKCMMNAEGCHTCDLYIKALMGLKKNKES